jgi:hypothetical protein
MPMMTEKLKKGQVESRHTDNMLALRWMDRQEVCMLTTLHTGTMRQTGKTDTPIVKTVSLTAIRIWVRSTGLI